MLLKKEGAEKIKLQALTMMMMMMMMLDFTIPFQ